MPRLLMGAEALPFGAGAEFFFTYSKNAVELFFMLSGFLTAYHYRNRIATMAPLTYAQKHYFRLLIPSVLVNAWALINTVVALHRIPGSEAYISVVTT